MEKEHAGSDSQSKLRPPGQFPTSGLKIAGGWNLPGPQVSEKRPPDSSRVALEHVADTAASLLRQGGEREYRGSKSWLLTSGRTPWASQCHSLWNPSYLPPSWCHRVSAAQCTHSWWTLEGRRICLWISLLGSSPPLWSAQTRMALLTSCTSTSSQTRRF